MDLFVSRRFSMIGRPTAKLGCGRNFENAYFTVEAALVFPVAISTILFVIFMLLYQYDRCLLEQDLEAIILWGSGQETLDAKELEERIQERIDGIYDDKYVAWEITFLEASLERKRFFIQGGGRVTFPVPQWNFWSVSNEWSTEARYSYNRLSPVTFIRLCRGLGQLLNEDEAEGIDININAER